MKILTCLMLLISSVAFAQYQFISPMPGSQMNNTERIIVIREGKQIDASTLKNNLFTIKGSKSGLHTFKMILTRDGKTINLNPDMPFAFDEEVTVTISNGIRSTEKRKWIAYSFSFKTHREYTTEEKANFITAKNDALQQELDNNGYQEAKALSSQADERDITGGYTIKVNTTPAPGQVFFDSWGSIFPSKYDGYNIMEPNGDSVYYSPKVGAPWDWDLNPNGYLSHWTNATFDVLDSNYNVIDNYTPKNGYGTDVHEFTLTEDNHAWMITDNPQVVNMKVYNASYCGNATVVGIVIQEQDEDHNLLFEWHSFDHIDVTEAPHENLASCYIDYMHTNSLDFDADGNILTSNRHLDQINYINKNTGEFIWRLGGDSNQFVFINDAEKFTYQHCARFLDNGNITLWDNGNYHSPSHSQAKEYEIDGVNKTATLVWHYQPLNYSGGNGYWFAMGSTQRLPNGNTFMGCGWDFSSNQSNFFEVDPAGNVVWEMALDNGKSLVSYRGWKHEWNPCAPVNEDGIKVKKITSTSAKVVWDSVSNATSYDVQYRKAKNTEWKVKNTIKIS
ncbi:MAG: arylsulfotransferase family protein [Chitinophagales bacterium]|nr:arylsulfotransferase family protein [Chitinophagales bacterium]